MTRSDWSGVSLPIGLLERLDKFLKSDMAKYDGFHSRADLITHILRKYLEELQSGDSMKPDMIKEKPDNEKYS